MDRAGGKSVLIVEDDRSMLKLLGAILGREPAWTVHEARTGKEALDIVASETPRVIVLDMMLPDMSGFEMIEHLRDQQGDPAAVIAITAATQSASPDAILRSEPMIREVLRKPVDQAKFLDTVRRVFNESEAGSA